ncbi:Intraflagellar transport protein 88, partial [Intoshia linei]
SADTPSLEKKRKKKLTKSAAVENSTIYTNESGLKVIGYDKKNDYFFEFLMSFMNLDENDIYDGYNDFNPSLSNEKYYIQRNDVKNTPINGKELLLRPKTSIVGAGYSNNNNKYSQFVELQNEIPNIGKTKNNQNSMSQNIKKMEQDIYLMLQNSIKLAQEGDITEAISKSEETYRKNKQFNNYKEEFNKDEMINDDIGFMVELNRATLYARNNMHQKALNIYQSIIKMKNSKNTMRIGKIRMNMGNVYYKLGQYGKALKLYKMAMDQIPNGYVSIRMKILHNIGIVQVRLSNYTEASNTFENIMLEKPNFSDAANLIVCYSHLNKISNIQDTFRNMLNIDLEITESDFYRNLKEDPKKNVIYDAIKNDCLSVYERKIQAEAEKCIKFTIQLISSLIDPNSNKGYEWCIQQVKSSNYREMSTDLDIDKAINFLKVEEIDKAIDILKSFELEGDSKEEFPNAIKYANIALEHDKYNPYALVNKANTTFQNGNYEQAREMYQEAINNDSTCTEALFNCGEFNLYEHNCVNFSSFFKNFMMQERINSRMTVLWLHRKKMIMENFLPRRLPF